MSTPRKRTKYEETVQRGAEEVARLVSDARLHYASPKEAVEQSGEWTNDQLVCRIKGHRFTVPITAEYYARHRYYFIQLGCEGGCGVEQLQEMNVRGHVYWKSMRYPGNYQSRSGRVVGDAKDALRVELIERVFKPKTSRKANVEPHSGYDEAVGEEEVS